MELFNVLGIDLKILIAQFVNFAIFFFVLYKFAYKPILKFLDERKNKIEKGITDAELAQKKLLEIEENEKQIIENAKIEAKNISKEIIEKAENFGEQKKKQIVEKTKEEVKKLIDQEKASIELHKIQTIKEIKKEVSDLVIDSLEKILEKKSDKEEITKAIKNISKE